MKTYDICWKLKKLIGKCVYQNTANCFDDYQVDNMTVAIIAAISLADVARFPDNDEHRHEVHITLSNGRTCNYSDVKYANDLVFLEEDFEFETVADYLTKKVITHEV